MITQLIINISTLIASYASINNKKYFDDFNKKFLPQILLTFAIILLKAFLYDDPTITFNYQIIQIIGALIAFILAYTYKYSILLCFAIVMLLQAISILNPTSLTLCAILFYGISILHTKNKNFKIIYQISALFSYVSALIKLLLLQKKDPTGANSLSAFATHLKESLNLQITLAITIGIIITIFTTLLFIWKKKKKIIPPLVGIFFTISTFSPLILNSTTGGVLIHNSIIVLQLIGLLFLGISLKKKNLINIGIACLFAYTFMRSYKLFELANLKIGIYLIVTGLFIIILGYILEKVRETFIDIIKAK